MRIPRGSRRYRAFLAVAGLAGALLVRLLGATWRVRVVGEDPIAEGKPLVAAYCWRNRGIVVPISQSRDGDLACSVLSHLGFGASPRGSSSRGATGLLRSLIRLTRAGETVGFLPDGPRGPARIAKPGVIGLARATGAPLVPVGISAHPSTQFGSWDRALLPLPFARVACSYGEPIRVPKNTTGESFEKLRGEFEATLDRMNHQLDAELGLAERPGAVAERLS